MKKIIYCIAMMLLSINITAQKLKTPTGKPGKMPLPSPTLRELKPDLKLISVRVISVKEDAARHLFETTLSITLKNDASVSTRTGFFLDLRSTYGTTSGGTGYSQIGANANIHVMAAGETRTVEYVFAKDITAMGRARLQAVIRLDPTRIITEFNEENNTSAFFYITPPRP